MLTKTTFYLLAAMMLTSCGQKNELLHICLGLSSLLLLSSIGLLLFVWIGTRREFKKQHSNWPKGFTTTKRN